MCNYSLAVFRVFPYLCFLAVGLWCIFYFEFNLSGFPGLLKSENLWHSPNFRNFWPSFFKDFFAPASFPSPSGAPAAHMLDPLLLAHKFFQAFLCFSYLIICIALSSRPLTLSLIISALLFNPLSKLSFFQVLYVLQLGNYQFFFIVFVYLVRISFFHSSVCTFTSWSLAAFLSWKIPTSGSSWGQHLLRFSLKIRHLYLVLCMLNHFSAPWTFWTLFHTDFGSYCIPLEDAEFFSRLSTLLGSLCMPQFSFQVFAALGLCHACDTWGSQRHWFES